MTETLKIAIPMAGLGTRMRPHTWSKPKPLISLAGKTVLDYVLDQFKSLPSGVEAEYVFVIGPHGDQLEHFMQAHHPDKKVHYVLQAEMRGQSDALWLAREHLKGPMLMAFSDTLVETDLSFINDPDVDGVACVKVVEDPRRFGVAMVNEQGFITRMIEKPTDMRNNLVVVGFYYFRDAAMLLDAIDEQMKRQVMLKNEFFLADAVNIMIERGAKLRTQRIETWLDAGTPESLLETNRFLMENGSDNSAQASQRGGIAIIPPVFIHPSAHIESSVIGPNVSIGRDCRVVNAVVKNSIIEDCSYINQMILEDSLVGQEVQLEGQSNRFNVGSASWVVR